MSKIKTLSCLLCSSPVKNYHQDKNRTYFQCTNCQLVFVDPKAFISEQEEKARYDLHQNSPNDRGYCNFLSRICDPIVSRLPKGSYGLDFGCGPGPTLPKMFEKLGYLMAIYDPFYANDKSVLEIEYDFVTATEVIEHLKNPKLSLNTMWCCIKPGGYLGIMTNLVPNKELFANWYYISDKTHICFYSKETFFWLSNQWHSEPIFVQEDVVIFQKNKC